MVPGALPGRSGSFPIEIWRAGEEESIQIYGRVELPPGEYRLGVRLWNSSTLDGGELSSEWIVYSNESAADEVPSISMSGETDE